MEIKPEVKVVPQKTEVEKPKVVEKKPETKPAESIQRPIPVPRFTAVPIEEETDATPIQAPVTPAPVPMPTVPPAPQAQPVVKPVTPPIAPIIKPAEPRVVEQSSLQGTAKPAEPITKKYVVDPYREPLN